MSYKDQFIWQKAIDLSVRCYKLTEYFPKSEIYGITSQTKAEDAALLRQRAEGFLFGRSLDSYQTPSVYHERGLYLKGLSTKEFHCLLPSAFCLLGRSPGQIRRCSVSIASNISEGYGRKGSVQYVQFLHIALGSARELDTQLIISLRVELAKPEYIKSVLSDCDEMQRLLVSTINKLTFDNVG